MPEINILEEKAVNFNELKQELDKIKKRDKEISKRAERTVDYLNKFIILKDKETKEIEEKLRKLEISRLKEKHIAKLVNILPEDMESLKSIFTGENITLKQEDLKRILECLK